MSDSEQPSASSGTEASGSSEPEEQTGIGDDQLPDDVRPDEEENPLAMGPTDEDDEDEGMSLGGDGGDPSA